MRAGPGMKMLVGTLRAVLEFRFQGVGEVSPRDPAFVRVHDDVLLTVRINTGSLRQKRTLSRAMRSEKPAELLKLARALAASAEGMTLDEMAEFSRRRAAHGRAPARRDRGGIRPSRPDRGWTAGPVSHERTRARKFRHRADIGRTCGTGKRRPGLRRRPRRQSRGNPAFSSSENSREPSGSGAAASRHRHRRAIARRGVRAPGRPAPIRGPENSHHAQGSPAHRA